MSEHDNPLASSTMAAPSAIAQDRPERGAARTKWLGCALVIVTFVFGLNYKLIIGWASPVWDADGYFAPYYTVVADAARTGHLLLWDPWTTCGAPAGVDPQVGAFSPLTILCGLITGGHLQGFALYWFSIWCFGGIGMLLLGRSLGASAWGALVVALGFTFCGVFTVQAQHTSHLVSLAFVPWVIWRLDRALLGKSWLPSAQSGALLGLSSLSGYPTMTMATGVLVLLWCAARLISGSLAGTAWHRLTRTVGASCLCGLISLAIFAPSYIAFTYETEGYSSRHNDVSKEVAIRHGIGYLNLATSLTPALAATDAWRNPRTAQLPQLLSGDASCTSIYFGILPLLLALAALISRPRDAFRWLLLITLAAYLSCAMSTVLPVCGWLYEMIPPLRYSRHAVLFRDHAMFLALVLAALAASDLTNGNQADRRRIWSVIAIGALTVATGTLLVWYAAGFAAVASRQYSHALPWTMGLALAAAVVGAMGWRANRSDTADGSSRRQGLLTVALVAIACADAYLNCQWNRPFLMADDHADAVRWANLAREHRSTLDLDSTRRMEGTLFNSYQVVTKTPSILGYTVLTNPEYSAMAANGTLAQLAAPAERFWFAPKAAVGEPRALRQARRRPPTTAPVTAEAPHLLVTQMTAAAIPGTGAFLGDETLLRPATVEIVRYQPDTLQIKASFDESGWLLVTDRWSPSWQASIDGVVVPVYQGERVFRAIQVPAGPCIIEFRFRPPYLVWILLSWSLLGGVGIWGAWNCIRPRKLQGA